MKFLKPAMAVFYTLFLVAVNDCKAQLETIPNIGKGTVIVYEIRENKVSYHYSITVNKISETDGVEFQWKTDEKPSRSGTTSMKFSNLSDGNKLMIKPVTGKEILGEDQLRIFFNNDVVTGLVSNKSADFSIDGQNKTFLYLATKAENTTLEFNNKKVAVDYTSGDAGDIGIGFIYLGDYPIVDSYRSKEFNLTLRSVSTK